MKSTAPFSFRGIALPDDLRESLDAFVKQGRPLGSFLRAVVDNDLSQAVTRADVKNSVRLPVIVAYLYNECPAGCWGFAGAHDAHCARKREERKAV